MLKIISPSARLLFHEAETHGYQPVWLIPELAFTGTADDQEFFVHGTKNFFNSQLGTRFADNKVLTRMYLERHHFPTMPFAYSANIADIHRFFDVYQPLIAKPVLGQRAVGVRYIEVQSKLDDLPLRDYFFERYIDGTEFRYVVLQGELAVAQQRTVTPTAGSPWHKSIANLAQSDWDLSLVNQSLKLAKALKMGFLAVDWIISQPGEASILEVNAAPGVYTALRPDAGEPVNLPARFLAAVVKEAQKTTV